MQKYRSLDRTKGSMASETIQKAESMAKVAVHVASNPQEIISGSVKKVEKMGLQTLKEIDHSRLNMKASTQLLKDTDEDDFDFCPDDSKVSKIRNLVWNTVYCHFLLFWWFNLMVLDSDLGLFGATYKFFGGLILPVHRYIIIQLSESQAISRNTGVCLVPFHVRIHHFFYCNLHIWDLAIFVLWQIPSGSLLSVLAICEVSFNEILEAGLAWCWVYMRFYLLAGASIPIRSCSAMASTARQVHYCSVYTWLWTVLHADLLAPSLFQRTHVCKYIHDLIHLICFGNIN